MGFCAKLYYKDFNVQYIDDQEAHWSKHIFVIYLHDGEKIGDSGYVYKIK